MAATQTSRIAVYDYDEAVLIDVPSSQLEPSTAIVETSEKISGGDWPVAIRMVERAAGLIKDYEKKLRTLEEDTRAYMLRVTEEHEKKRERTLELETQLEHLEAVLTHTSEELRETRVEAAKTALKLRSAEARLAEADTEIKRGVAYVRHVERLLGNF